MEKTKYTYIEVRRDISSKVVKRLDVSSHRMSAIQTIEDGINRNMNYLEYTSYIVDSEKELKEI